MARRRNPVTPYDSPGYDMPYEQPTSQPPSTYQPPTGFAPGEPDPNGGGQPPSSGPGYQTRLEGFDSGKLGDPSHAGKSPKYALGQLLNSGQYGYQDGEKILKALQDQYDYYDNWTYSGDKFRWSGEGELAGEFEGVDEIDFVRNATQGGEFDPGQAAFWFGASSPQSRSAAMNQGGTGGLDPSFLGGASDPLPQFWQEGGGGYQAGGGGGTSMQSGPLPEARTVLQQLIQQGGGLNQDILTRRVEGAREAMERTRRSQTATDRAMLAERGLLGSGPEISAVMRGSEALSDRYAGEVNQIYANESENADSRLMQSLSLLTGMTLEQSRQAIDQYRAETDRSVGMGNIGLGYHRAGNDFTLGMGGLALGNLQANLGHNQFLATHGLNSTIAGQGLQNQRIGLILQLLNSGMSIQELIQAGYI